SLSKYFFPYCHSLQVLNRKQKRFIEYGNWEVRPLVMLAKLRTTFLSRRKELRDKVSSKSLYSAGSVTPKLPSTDIFDMIPFSPISPQSSVPTHNGMQPPPVPSRSNEIKRDLFGAEPFDPFNCGAGDFPPDIQSKLDEMQVTILTDWPIVLFFFPPLWFLDNVIYYILCDFPYYSRCNNTSLS
ncbi:hypothetical protein FD754_003213, partial [Muntiacus muntjak]